MCAIALVRISCKRVSCANVHIGQKMRMKTSENNFRIAKYDIVDYRNCTYIPSLSVPNFERSPFSYHQLIMEFIKNSLGMLMFDANRASAPKDFCVFTNKMGL